MDTDQDYEAELPFLAGFAACLRFSEELTVLVSGPMLTVGLGIGLVSLLSDGALLVTAPWLLYAWAISQTVGVDGQLVGAWYRVRVAQRSGKWALVACFVLLGLALAYVGLVGSLIFALQQAYHLTTAQALAQLGMDSHSWLWQRAGVSVFLVCLSGYLRYQVPRKQKLTLEEQRQQLQEQMELADLKQAAQAKKLQGFSALVGGAAKAARQAAHEATQQVSATQQPKQTEATEAEEREVSADAAAPLSPLSPVPVEALPMAWPQMPLQQRSQSSQSSQNSTPAHNGTH